MITHDDYQNKTKEFVIYPKEVGILYTIIGLTDETIELYEKHSINNINGMKDECGDCLFYLANVCTELQIDFNNIINLSIYEFNHRIADELLIISGKILGKMKKIIRDDKSIITEIKKQEIIILLQSYYHVLNIFCEDMLNDSIENIMENNVEKLSSRKERNVISGSGDKR
jgi:NTP pyrophosphatase (non-canonical NTP hydrolase)